MGTHAFTLLVSVRGSGRILSDDGWVKLLVLFNVRKRTSWTRFTGIPLDEKGRKKANVELQGPDASRLPVGFLNFFLCKPEPIGSSRFNRREAGKVDLNDEQKLRYNG